MSRLKQLRLNGSYFCTVLIGYILEVHGHPGFLFDNLDLTDILLVIDSSLLTESLLRTLKKLPDHRHFLSLCNDGSCCWLEVVVFLCDIDVGIGLNDIEILRFLEDDVTPGVHGFELRIVRVGLQVQRQLMRLLARNRLVHFISVALTRMHR